MNKLAAMLPALLLPTGVASADEGDNGFGLAAASLVLTSGTYDEFEIDGLEIRPLGLDSVEFDKTRTMEVSIK